MRKDLKETNIHFTEGENKVFVFTCNTDLKKRLKKTQSQKTQTRKIPGLLMTWKKALKQKMARCRAVESSAEKRRKRRHERSSPSFWRCLP